MSDIKEFHEMDPASMAPWAPPDWVKEWGPGMILHRELLNGLYHYTHRKKWEMSERSKIFKLFREGLIPIKNRWEHSFWEEHKEAGELCDKYNKSGTGIFDVITKDYNEFMADFTSKYPDQVWIIEEFDRPIPVAQKFPSKVLAGEGTGTVTFRYGVNPSHEHLLAVQGLEAVRDRLTKRATLQEEQIQLLALAFEEKGLQLPPQFAAIQKQLDELKRSTDMPTQAEKVPRREVFKPVGMMENADGKTFTAIFENETERRVLPPPEMNRTKLEFLWGYMEDEECSRIFQDPPTKKTCPKYFEVVKQHRDFYTIDNRIMTELNLSSREFVADMRLMIDNYCHFFGEGSHEYEMALKFKAKVFEYMTEHCGREGRTTMAHYEEAPRAVFDENKEVSDDNGHGRETNEDPDVTLHTIQDDETVIRELETPRPHDQATPTSGKDNTLDRAWKEMEKGLQYDKDAGKPTQAPRRRDQQQPGGPSSARPPTPRLDDDEQGEQHVGEQSFYDAYDYPNPESDDFEPPPEGLFDEPNADDTLASYHPQSDDDEQAHASASGSSQPAARAPVAAEAPVIDLTSPSHGQTTHTSSASTKRARDDDDQESSDDDAPLLKRTKAAGKTPISAAAKGKATASAAAKGKGPAPVATSSSRKRSHDESDEDSDEDWTPEQPATRKRKTSSKGKGKAVAVPVPVAAPVTKDKAPASAAAKGKAAASAAKGKAPASAAATTPSSKRPRDDDGDDHEPERSSKRQKSPPAPAQTHVPAEPAAAGAGVGAGASEPDIPFEHYKALRGRVDVALELQERQQMQQLRDSLPARPEPEPLTPPRVVAGPSQPEPATSALGHTDQGTITTMQLHRMGKWKKDAANRPWVFGHSLGGQYALYIMRCPTKRCPAPGCTVGPEAFSKHPLIDNDSAFHLEQCVGEFGGGDQDKMVRKFCKQVISDAKKPVTIEWARKWNNTLIADYGYGEQKALCEHNF